MIEEKSLEVEKTVLVGIINSHQDAEKSKEYLDELAFLAYTAGGEVMQRFTQKIELPNPKTFIGTGKIEALATYVHENDISTVIFDDELTPAQQGNIEKMLKIKVLDRTGLILDIFAQRAQTSYARTQVELAQYEYLLPRLKGLWTHLERQRGELVCGGLEKQKLKLTAELCEIKFHYSRKSLSLLTNKWPLNAATAAL